MKTIVRPVHLLLLLPLPLLAGAAAEKPAFLPQEGTSQTKRFALASEMTLEDLTVEVDGNDVSSMAGNIEMAWKVDQTVAVTDHYESTTDGRPAKLRRSYNEIEHKTHISGSNPMTGEQESDVPASSELEGATVVFSWNEGDSDYDVAYADDADGDEELLTDLVEEMDLRGFLPGKDVAAGDSWEIPMDAVRHALGLGGDLKLRPEGKTAGNPGMESFSAHEMMPGLEGKCTGTYNGAREEDGVRVGVIQLALDVKAAQDLTGKLDAMKEQIRENVPAEVELDFTAFDVEYGYESEGELLWNLETGLPFALQLSGEVNVTLDTSMNMNTGQGEQAIEQSMTFAGTQTLKLTTE
jgi:hypothetical protein